MLALLVSTWELSATPHALQSWEKASLASGMRIWDEPYQQVQFGRGPTADSDRESACKRVAANVGRRDMTRFCVAVQVGWNTCLDSCHHCNVCSRCLFAPCLSSHRTWPARIPLPAAPNVFQLQNRRFFLFQEAARWLPDEVFQRLAQVEVAHLTDANKYLEEFIQNNKVPRDPMQGKTATRLPSSSRCKSRRGPNRQEVECLEQAGEETAQMVHDRLMPQETEAEDPVRDEAGSNMAQMD